MNDSLSKRARDAYSDNDNDNGNENDNKDNEINDSNKRNKFCGFSIPLGAFRINAFTQKNVSSDKNLTDIRSNGRNGLTH